MNIKAIQNTKVSDTDILEVGGILPLNGSKIVKIVKDGSAIEPVFAVHTENKDVLKVPSGDFMALYTK